MITTKCRLGLLVLLLSSAAAPSAPAAFEIFEGDVCPEVALGRLAGGDGRDRLTQFRGQPVLFAMWMNVTYGMEAARRGVELKSKYGKDGLQVFLASMDVLPDDDAWAKAEAMLDKSYPNHRCRVGIAPPIPTRVGAKDMPPLVYLIGVDGTLRIAGGNSNVGGRLEKLVDAEIDRAKSGWGKDPVAKKARAAMYGKRSLAEARKALAAAATPANAEDVDAAKKELDALFESRLGSLRHFMEAGRWQEALDAAAALRESIRGDADFETAVAADLAKLDSAEAKHEAELEKKAKPLFAKIDAGKADAGVAKSLEKLAAENPGTKLGARALAAAKVAKELSKL